MSAEFEEHDSMEIEAKMAILDSELEPIRGRLEAMGAVAGPVIRELNLFLDTPAMELKSADRGLRVRSEFDLDGRCLRTVITHKGPRLPGDLKTRPEHEAIAADHEDAVRLFESMGYVKVLSFEKERRTWHLGRSQVMIDRVPLLGFFVEIEAPDELTVRRLQSDLLLGDKPLIQESYIGLLLDRLKDEGIGGDHIALES